MARCGWMGGVVVACWLVCVPAGASVRTALERFLPEDPTAVDRLLADLGAQVPTLMRSLKGAGPAGEDEVRALLQEQVSRNLEAKAALRGPHGERFPLTEEEIRRTVIEYEAFKLAAYVSSGVFPKRYFGFFDGKWDTAAEEVALVVTTRRCTDVVNAWLAEQGDAFRVTDMEIAVTWVAEGGALLLTEQQDQMDQVHPIYGVGLDSIAYGTADLASLMAALDGALGTGLVDIVEWRGEGEERQAYLTRMMTYEESIAGTALMWVWEKRIAQRKLLEEGRAPIHDRPLDEQFILGSLVYNSGLLHAAGRETMIRDFACGAWIAASSERNAHRRNVINSVRPAEALEELLRGDGYRDQFTSWLAVYHVTQRYGGYEGLRRFTDVFGDDGMFRPEAWEHLRRNPPVR